MTDDAPATDDTASRADEPERTPDGHFLIINGRKWRASDPSIPEALRTELVNELMRARREVRTRGDEVRPCVHDAKVALAERGEPWWEPTPDGQRVRLASAIRVLLRHRGESTICPSDAARVVGGDAWRDLMPMAREVAAELAERGELVVRQRGADVDPSDARGPIRLAAGPALRR